MNGVFVQLMTLMLVGTLTACGGSGAQTTPGPSQTVPPTSSAPVESQPAANGASHVLVAYFSATGNTENIAGHIQAALDADLYEIVPEEPYTSENLDYTGKLIDREKKVGLVTNNFHIYRALKMAKKQGYTNVSGLAAPSDPLYQIHYLVREFFAMIKAVARGDISLR